MPTYADMSLIRTAHESALLAGRAGDRLRHPAGPGRRRPGQMTTRGGGSSRNRSEPRPAPASRYRLATDRLADLMATATELGLTKPNKYGVLVLKTLSRAPLNCSTASFLPVREQRRGSGTTACSRDMRTPRVGAMVLGARQAAPSTALGGPLPFPRGRTARLWAAPDCPWIPSNARSMPMSYCHGDAANRAA
jgi:hypothetical protein